MNLKKASVLLMLIGTASLFSVNTFAHEAEDQLRAAIHDLEVTEGHIRAAEHLRPDGYYDGEAGHAADLVHQSAERLRAALKIAQAKDHHY